MRVLHVRMVLRGPDSAFEPGDELRGREEDRMNEGWLIAGAVLVIAAVIIGRLVTNRRGQPDLGAVSEQWLSEQRLSQSAVEHR